MWMFWFLPLLKDLLTWISKLPSFPNHTVAVKYATEHRCGVRVRGPGLTDMITGTDPLKDKYVYFVPSFYIRV